MLEDDFRRFLKLWGVFSLVFGLGEEHFYAEI